MIEGVAVDLSNAGVCVTLPSPLILGALLRLSIDAGPGRVEEQTRVGRVCFCIRRPEGFRVGFQLL